MSKLATLIKALEPIVKAENDELKEQLEDQGNVDLLVDFIEEYETTISKLLKKQRKLFLKTTNNYINKAVSLSGLMKELHEAMDKDYFGEEVSEASQKHLRSVLETVTPLHMDAIDKDVAFSTLSPRTNSWVKNWSRELGEIMKLQSHAGVENLLDVGIAEGSGIQEIASKMEDLPQFNRNRARATAMTEVLTANSVSQLESFRQSPVVGGKRWKHSGGGKIQPRPAHVALSGTKKKLDEKFFVNGLPADHPRDPALPPRERVFCHCAMGPVTDDSQLSLSPEEKVEAQESYLKSDEARTSSVKVTSGDGVTLEQESKAKAIIDNAVTMIPESKRKDMEFVILKDHTDAPKEMEFHQGTFGGWNPNDNKIYFVSESLDAPEKDMSFKFIKEYNEEADEEGRAAVLNTGMMKLKPEGGGKKQLHYDLETLFRHESGHFLMEKDQDGYYKVLEEAFGRWVEGTYWARDNVSAYAGTNASEAMMEMFALYTKPDYEKGYLPEAVEDYFDTVLSD